MTDTPVGQATLIRKADKSLHNKKNDIQCYETLEQKKRAKSLTQYIFVSVKACLKWLVFMDPFERFP